MITEMYYDTVDEKFILQKPNTLAISPNRYIPINRGSSGIYIEHWLGNQEGHDDTRCLNIAYDADIYDKEDEHDFILQERLMRNQFTPTRIHFLTIPQEKFDEYLKEVL